MEGVTIWSNPAESTNGLEDSFCSYNHGEESLKTHSKQSRRFAQTDQRVNLSLTTFCSWRLGLPGTFIAWCDSDRAFVHLCVFVARLSTHLTPRFLLCWLYASRCNWNQQIPSSAHVLLAPWPGVASGWTLRPFLLFQEGFLAVMVVLTLNHYSNPFAASKDGAAPIKLGKFLTLSPPDHCFSLTVVVLKHFLKTYGLLGNSPCCQLFSIKPVLMMKTTKWKK